MRFASLQQKIIFLVLLSEAFKLIFDEETAEFAASSIAAENDSDDLAQVHCTRQQIAHFLGRVTNWSDARIIQH